MPLDLPQRGLDAALGAVGRDGRGWGRRGDDGGRGRGRARCTGADRQRHGGGERARGQLAAIDDQDLGIIGRSGDRVLLARERAGGRVDAEVAVVGDHEAVAAGLHGEALELVVRI